MPELTDDEFTVLSIANGGESMIAMGRWMQPIEHLVELGLMRSVNKANNYITDQGRVALERHEKVVDDGFANALIAGHNARVISKNFAEEAAQKLAEAARVAAKATGDSLESAARNWSKVILERALELLK